MSWGNFYKYIVSFSVVGSLWLGVSNPVAAQAPPMPPMPQGDAPQAQAPSASDQQDLLKLADAGLESLSKVDVVTRGTAINPIVEGVSKKKETLSEAPGIVDVITAKDIQQFGAKNLYEVLQRGTSVFMTGDYLFRNNVASIRGALINHEDNHVLILINGRPFRDVTTGGVNVAAYLAFPIETIERVEIIRGPGSILYGSNAFVGTINIVTKTPDKPTVQASVLAGSYGYQQYSMTAGRGTESNGFLAGAMTNREKGWPFSATTGPNPGQNGSALWGQDNVGVFTMYNNGNFRANLFAADASQDVLRPDSDFPAGRFSDPRVFTDLGYLLEVDDRRSFDVHFTFNYDNTQFPSVIPPFTYAAPSQSYLLEGTYRSKLNDRTNLMVGGLTDIHTGNAELGPLAPVPAYDLVWYGLYMNLDYQLTERTKLIGGMQANMPGQIQGGIVPRAGMITEWTEHWTTKLLYGQAFRSPYRTEQAIFVPGVLQGNPALAPETIQTFDAQIAYRNDDFRLALTYFHSDFFDIISRVGVFPQSYENGGDMKVDGFELENAWQLSEHWRCLGSTTYQYNVRDGVADTTTAPNWMAKAGLAYYDDARGFNIGMFDTYIGSQTVPDGALNVNPPPSPYHLVSLNTTYDLARRWGWRDNRTMRLQFLIENLFDESINAVEFQNRVVNTLPAGSGQTFYGGLTMGF